MPRQQAFDLGPDHDLATFAGVVTRVVFRNDDTGYSVLDIEGYGDGWIVVGVMPHVVAGDYVKGDGTVVEHPTYGPQIRVRMIEKTVPEDRERIERYLASGAIKGIGKVRAKRLVEAFGDATLDVMRESPERVARVRGIGLKQARTFSEQLKSDVAFQSLQLFLLPMGIGPARALRIHEAFGISAEYVIRQNPFILAEKIRGIGFQTADRLARELGLAGDHPARMRGALLYAMRESVFRDGNTVTRSSALIRHLSKALDVAKEPLERALRELVDEGEIIDVAAHRALAKLPDDAVALREMTLIEDTLAQRIHMLATHPAPTPHFMAREQALQAIEAVVDDEPFDPGPEQIEALIMALGSPLSVLTGGPGTGKTTIVRLLTRILSARGESIALAAPTGRAAQRLSDVCRMPASTLHRLLAIRVRDDNIPDAAYWLDVDDAVACDTLIVDECSMIDIFLFAKLMVSVPPATRVLLIGDADQLPSIGPGQVLRDLLQAPFVPHTRLTEIYRQEAHKLIVTNAHRILRGEPLELEQSLASDFLFIPTDNEQAMQDGVIKLCRDILPEHYDTDGIYGAQILSAIRRGPAGVIELNRVLQTLAHGSSFDAIETHGYRIAAGDKVMQTRNNYDLAWEVMGTGTSGTGVMNGEMGIVQTISPSDRSITVCFEDERVAVIQGESLEDIDLAYATTIHKSQGSEYGTEILVIPAGASGFLTRNLLYTGVTRAKEQLFILTRKSTLTMMLKNNEANERQGLLPALFKVHAHGA
ncbi:MAG: AAA family ATPase [Saccharofermentanales bacterium]